ncbi:MAG TPA: hypothetical protein VG965_04265 [Patescibacteria group bacterium]|nr:hypothetical protein [Patescibacteria group bacterium]
MPEETSKDGPPSESHLIPIGENGMQPTGLKSKLSVGLHEVGRRIKHEPSDEEVVTLAGDVLKKLLEGIEEGGTVSLFNDIKSGDLVTAVFHGEFTSAKIPHLDVSLWKKERKPNDETLSTQKQLFNETEARISLQASEASPLRRSLVIRQLWDAPENDYSVVFVRDIDNESVNTALPRRNSEKVKFMQDILETKVDVAANEAHFGRPYFPGDTRSATRPGDKADHTMHWVRDVKDRLPLLTAHAPALITGPSE